MSISHDSLHYENDITVQNHAIKAKCAGHAGKMADKGNLEVVFLKITMKCAFISLIIIITVPCESSTI